MRQLARKTDRYALTEDDIALISTASALHDIGKISIPDSILNKPGKLTAEEFEVVKTHAAVGASILQNLPMTQDEPLIQVAYQICRWHHERYDGHGYPDGLVGDQIPITAQVVSLADVYDALTGERCYKKAYPHETAVRMIQNGECGVFNPLLIECLLDIQDQLQREIGTPPEARNFSLAAQRISDHMVREDDLPFETTCNTARLRARKTDVLRPFAGGLQSITTSGRTRPPSAIIPLTPSAKTERSQRMRCFAFTPSRPRTAAVCGTQPSRPRPNRPTLPSRRRSPCAAKKRSAESPFERCGRAS
ncbi:MAG: HD-GYP domain-containing protein [Christensenellales bacterium]